MAVTLGRKGTQFPDISFTLGWAEVTPGQTLIDVFFSVSIWQLCQGRGVMLGKNTSLLLISNSILRNVYF